MPATTYPNLGLKAGYLPNEDGWGDDMTANIRKLSVLAQATVIARVAAYPDAPTNGDVYVNTVTQKIGVRESNAWIEYTPLEGWLVYDRDTDVYVRFDGATWVELETGGSDGVPEAPADGKTYGRKDLGWEEIETTAGGNSEPYGKHAYWAFQFLGSVNNSFAGLGELGLFALPTDSGAGLTTGGTPIGSPGTGDVTPVFDGDPTVTWNFYSDGTAANKPWVGYQFAQPVSITKAIIDARYPPYNSRPNAGKIRYSDDGITWFDAWTITEFSGDFANVTVSISPDFAEGSAPIGEAPEDGKFYARKDGDWAEIISDEDPDPIGDAPEDGKVYGRKDGEWFEIVADEDPDPVAIQREITGFMAAVATSGEVLQIAPSARAWTLPANMAGSVGFVGTNPTAAFVLTVRKNGDAIGTINVSTGGVMTFATTGGVAVVFNVGDTLRITAPATADTTAANIGWAILGSVN